MKFKKTIIGVSCLLGIMMAGCGNEEEQIINYIQDTEQAQDLGYKLDYMEEDTFVITKESDVVYVISPTENGMNRASQYLQHNLLDSNGKVIMENGDSFTDYGKNIKSNITIGDVSIDNYAIVYGSEEVKEYCEELQYYILQTGNVNLEIKPEEEAGEYIIKLSLDETIDPEKKDISILDGQIYITSADLDTLQETVYLFVNQYLGWMKAGEEGERISDSSSEIHIPGEVMEQDAWIEEREAVIVLWNINYNRGTYLNADTTLENSIMHMSEEQLYEYVKMLKFCGYTGIQITEMCSTWAGVGGYEVAHERIRMLADAAHALDMNVTIWVWGAEFTGYGWVDNSVAYYEEGYSYAFESPKVIETFDKYYSIYAELADCCDRLIGHYYDPGNLHSAEDIAYFAKMLRDKFMAVNPDIDFGISCWVDAYDKNVFVEELGTDITLYESGHHDNEEDYESFRGFVDESGCRLGTWGWYTIEMEIDQLAQMNFNLDVIRSVYQTARKYDSICKSSYWSEMDTYHILNVFSLYCAGQMLIDPDVESEVLVARIAEATVGSEYADAFGEMLRIIQDARSGNAWDTYFWSYDNYVLKSDAYPAESILERCNQYIPILDEMIEKDIEANTLPLSISLKQLLQMMRPQLEQIRDFAQFRIDLDELENQYQQGVSKTELKARIYEIGNPIDSYNSIIGVWGQVEARAQRELVIEFCNNSGISIPIYGSYDKQRKDYMYAQFASQQRGLQEPLYIEAPYYQFGLAYGIEETNRLIDEMVDEGLLTRGDDNKVYLTDWDNYIYHFN